MKWLVLSSHDERYDLNLQLRVFHGTLEDFEKNDEGADYTREQRKEWKDGVYVYHRKHRSNEYGPNILKEDWDIIKAHVELVYYSTTILIPFECLLDENFFLENPIVEKNVKFGILDLI